METMLKDKIYVSLSRWLPPLEEHKGSEDVYTSSDEDSAPLPSPSKMNSGFDGGTGLTMKFKAPAAGQTVKFRPKKMEAPVRRKHVQKANPNALFVQYAKLLAEPSILSSEKPIFCSKCRAVRNNVNSIDDKESWTCGFCNTPNPIPDGAVPRLEGPNVKYAMPSSGVAASALAPSYVIIIDRSGSMSVTVSEKKSVLSVLVEALKNVLKEILTKNPNSRVGLIIVSKKLEILGDCSSPPQEINDTGILNNEQKLKRIGEDARKAFFHDNIAQSIGRLTETISKLEEGGMTALGPSIVCGLELLKGLCNGRMMVFTDGLSNVGVGDIEPEKGVVKPGQKDYYNKWAQQAREQGTAINFFAIDNSEFDVGLYSKVAKETEGSIYQVDPSNILCEIGLPEENKQLGTNADVEIVLPAVLRFWRVLEIGAQVNSNRFRKSYGILTEKTRDIIHFVVNPEAMPLAQARRLESLPVQVKMKWRSGDGKENMLVATKLFPVIMRRLKDIDTVKLKDLMDKLSKDMVLQGKQDKVEVELKDMLDEYLAKPVNEVEENLKKEAVAQRDNVIKSKTSTSAKTVLFTRKFKPSDNSAKTVEFKKKL
eukprot:TRINITY_DN1320_c0_g1_i2.p1 TRINITY_DN1320_c0_g1~~TRINITY_DN1320_c0_g1_i2.p1  ORF type:complete len:596 (+),score=161.22 TRINITY_DN1320_c0_g1_i2:162-1949(+)